MEQLGAREAFKGGEVEDVHRLRMRNQEKEEQQKAKESDTPMRGWENVMLGNVR